MASRPRPRHPQLARAAPSGCTTSSTRPPAGPPTDRGAPSRWPRRRPRRPTPARTGCDRARRAGRGVAGRLAGGRHDSSAGRRPASLSRRRLALRRNGRIMIAWYLARGAGLAAFADPQRGHRDGRRHGPAPRQPSTAGWCCSTCTGPRRVSGVVLLVPAHRDAAGRLLRQGRLGRAPGAVASSYRPLAVTLGVLSMYLLVAVTVTGMLRGPVRRVRAGCALVAQHPPVRLCRLGDVGLALPDRRQRRRHAGGHGWCCSPAWPWWPPVWLSGSADRRLVTTRTQAPVAAGRLDDRTRRVPAAAGSTRIGA